MGKSVEIFKKIRLLESTQIDYLDETSKVHDGYHERKAQKNETKNSSSEKLHSYIAKEFNDQANVGKIFAGGYFRKALVDKFHQSPESMPIAKVNHEIQKLVTEIGKKYGPYRGKLGMHCLISLSPESMTRIEAAGGDIDKVLHGIVTKTMKQYNAKFYPQEKLGYAFAIHHDTDHRHAHIYLSNRTDQGNYVSMSDRLEGKIDKKQKKPRENQLEYMRQLTTNYTHSAVDAVENSKDDPAQISRVVEQAQAKLDADSYAVLKLSETRINTLIFQRKLAEERHREDKLRLQKDIDYAIFKNSVYKQEMDKYYRDLEANRDVSNSHFKLISDHYKNKINSGNTSFDHDLKLDSLRMSRAMAKSLINDAIKKKKFSDDEYNFKIKNLNNEINNQIKFTKKLVDTISPQDKPSKYRFTAKKSAINEAAKEFAKSGDVQRSTDIYSSMIKVRKIVKMSSENKKFTLSNKYEKHQINDPFDIDNPWHRLIARRKPMDEITRESIRIEESAIKRHFGKKMDSKISNSYTNDVSTKTANSIKSENENTVKTSTNASPIKTNTSSPDTIKTTMPSSQNNQNNVKDVPHVRGPKL